MKNSAQKYTTLVIIIFLFILAIVLTPYQKDVIAFAKEHPYSAPAVIIFWRILAVIIPPIPGGLISLACIPIFGWFWSFIYGMVSVVLGTSTAFWIGRHAKQPFIEYVVPLKHLRNLETRLSKKQEFFTFLLIRITTGPFFDVVSYIAGMSTMRFRLFFLVVVIAELPTALVYYLTDKGYQKISAENESLGLITFAIIIILYVFFTVFRKPKFTE